MSRTQTNRQKVRSRYPGARARKLDAFNWRIVVGNSTRDLGFGMTAKGAWAWAASNL